MNFSSIICYLEFLLKIIFHRFFGVLYVYCSRDCYISIYISEKNKNKRCQALPHANLRYCLQHRNQDPRSKQFHETDPEILELIVKNKQIYETDPEILKEAIESIKNLN
jgi:hypothetical protein